MGQQLLVVAQTKRGEKKIGTQKKKEKKKREDFRFEKAYYSTYLV